MYQIALLGVLRGSELKKNLNFLAKVCARLTKITEGTASQSLWKVSIAVLEGLLNGSIETSVAIKILLRQIDRQIKLIITQGDVAIEQPAPDDLLKNFLYYVARSKASSRYIQEIKIDYKLDAALLGEDELLEDEVLAGPESTAMKSVIDALNNELQLIKQLVNDSEGVKDGGALIDVLPMFRRISDAMAILGLGAGLKPLHEAHSYLAKCLAAHTQLSAEDISQILQLVNDAENSINPSAIIEEATTTEKELFLDHEEAQEQLDKAFVSVLRESREGLEQIKDAIIEFVASKWEQEILKETPDLLISIEGSLKMVPLSRAAAIVKSCRSFLEEKLLGNEGAPDWLVLDTLADAIASLDYYFERLPQDTDIESQAILDIAVERVAELGYPIDNDTNLQPSADVISFPEGVPLEEAEPTQEPTADASESDDEIDPEIIEIFIEEAGEVLDIINESLPQWKESWSNEEARSTVRRAFHTLKGSGRMVGATNIGDLGWAIENLLNRVCENAIDMDQARFDLIDAVLEKVPELVEAFEKSQPVDRAVFSYLIDQADLLAAEQSPDLSAIITTATVENASVPVEEIIEAPDTSVDDEILDQELLEVFTAEAKVHEEVIDDFIAHCRELAGPADLTDNLQRALHTLKGSANMAGVIPIVDVVTPLERMIKELRASNLKADSNVVEALGRGSLFIKAGIEQLVVTPLQKLPSVDAYVEDIERLREDYLDRIGSQLEEGAVAPEALSQFLTESLDQITEVSAKLTLWREGQLSVDEMKTLSTLLDTITEHAEAISVLAPVELGGALQALYRRAAEHEHVAAGDNFFDVASRGNDALIDMLDQLAGQQTPSYEAALLSDIQAFEFMPVEKEGGVSPDADDEFDLGLDGGSLDLELDEAESAAQEIEESENVFDASILSGLGIDIGNDTDDSITDALNDFIEQDDVADESVGEKDKIEVSDEEITASLEKFVEVVSASVNESALSNESNESNESEDGVEETTEAAFSDDSDEAIDPEILEIFLEEANDLLEDMDETVHKWDEDRENRTHLDDMLRILHTMKGGARLTGVTQLGDLTHDFETSLINADIKGLTVDDEFIAELQQYQDQIITLVGLANGEDATASAVDVSQTIEIVESLNVSQESSADMDSDSADNEKVDNTTIDAEKVDATEKSEEISDAETVNKAKELIDIAGRDVDKSAAEIVPFVASKNTIPEKSLQDAEPAKQKLSLIHI